MSKTGVSKNRKANEIMSTVKKNITTPERFNELLHSLHLDNLAGTASGR